MVALKERINEKDKYVEIWKKEIETLKRICKEIPSLVTPRFICTLDDSKRKIEEKYIVMEWVEGSDLSKINLLFQTIKEQTEKEKEFLRMMLILINELQKMHSSFFIHRDIKLENIMCYKSKQNYSYIFIDFGSSFHLKDPIEHKLSSLSPPYSPPEQNTLQESFKSDLFSLGVCFEKALHLISLQNKEGKKISLFACFPSPLLEIIQKMKEREIEKRIDVNQCKEKLLYFATQFFPLFLGQNFYDQPFLSDHNKIRLLIEENEEMHLLHQNQPKKESKRMEDGEICDQSGRTALHFSVIRNDLKEISFLLDKKLDVNKLDMNGENVLHYACSIRNNNNSKINLMQLLIDKKASINQQNKDGDAPLHHLSVKKSNLESIRFLVKNNADLNLKNHLNLSPIDILSQIGIKSIED